MIRWLSEAFRARWYVGVRAGLSVGLPLVAGVLAGHPDWGAVASLGGIAGVYGADSPRRHRMRLVAAVGVTLAVVVPVSSLCAAHPWLSVAFVGVVAALAGFGCLALRVPPPREYLIILPALVATGVAAEPLREAALVAAGALVGLLVAAVPVPREPPQNRAVRRAWLAVQDVLRTAGTPGAAGTRRRAVADVARARDLLRQARVPGTDDRLRELAAAEVVLASALSVSLDAREPLPPDADVPGLRWAREAADGILRGEQHDLPEPEHRGLGERLREALSPHAVVLPAAARIGVAVAIGYALGRLLGLAHAYWVGLTVAAVLQATNLTLLRRRSLHRVAGTAVGVGLAAAVFAPHPPALAVALVALLAQLVAEVFMPVSYGFAVAFVTLVPLAIFDLAAPGAQIGAAVGARALDTALGAVLALVLRLVLWPKATAARLPQVQARTLRAVAGLFGARWLGGDQVPARRRLQEAVLDLHNVTQDAFGERWDQVGLAVDELAFLALGVPFGRPHPPRPEAEALLSRLEQLADALSRGTPPPDRHPPALPGYPRTSAATQLLAGALAS
ncbi:putative membrane protein YccC [Amycolatopsis bartoniae]|uniref:Integral membrane bound transporter domain-containing protein n=1 Tax=Amycolatopsis bartoniae TaxID=941986 RepID=A0A8H9M9C4_9PSEU|nr:FUSC family protein [Amycolatopsis bartoniae]MBB2937731.1 putative membrane protein YccC [Amycolatopsis bartoniae]TVT08187.1 hypothetical protein FNH07_13375 [Amycolatopsis bartoniae]GHF40281.1 hypothetical protein GCM10017566_12070 [Amycolatopsis bartoniae]